ncbi:MAG TPA: hypothetical protein VLU25_13840 [Acidobacteriota bacterium]|nr:hypothetical protein [Acidobacteriota bacterium]
MGTAGFTARTLKTARKVVDTVFPHYQVSAADRNRMLQAATVIALADVAGSRTIRWRSPPPSDSVPAFADGGQVVLQPQPESRYRLRKGYSEEKVDRAFDECEALFDRYQLPDDERASLYSALPCLGLSALDKHIEWLQPPPFL